jgi:mannosyltransferase
MTTTNTTTPGPPAPRWPAVLAVAATTIAAALVAHRLGTKSFWHDEAFSVGVVDRPFGDVLWRIANWEVNQSPFYLLLAGWWRLGQGEVFLRLLPATFAVASVPALFQLGRRIAGARIAAVAALLLACHPFVVEWGQQLRAYSLALLLTILATTLLLRATEVPSSTARPLLYAVVAALATYSHFYAGLVVGAHAVWLVTRRPLPRRLLLAAGGPYAVMVAPLAVYLATREGDPISWVGSGGNRNAVVETATQLTGGTGWSALAWALAGTCGAWASIARWRGGEERAVLPLVWVATPLAVVSVSTLLFKPLLEARFLIVLVPALVLLGATGILWLPRPARPVALVALLVLSGVGLERWYSWEPAEDWRAAAQIVAETAAPGTDVVIEPWSGVFALRYYEQDLDLPRHEVIRPGFYDPPASDPLVEVQGRSAADTAARLDPLYVAWRDSHYDLRSERVAGGIVVRTYARRGHA